MNSYEQKQADRKARYEAKADSLATDSASTHARARELAGVIPLGQPVLIDHYSAKRDMSYRAKVQRTYEKSFALSDLAEHYKRKAEGVGTGGISSDDPDALDKLRAEVAALEASQQRMKDANAVIRKHRAAGEPAQIAALVALGNSEAAAREMLQPDYAGRVGFAAYQLSNQNSNIRRIHDRIKTLSALKERDSRELAGPGYTYREDTEENRVMFFFEGKPDEATRAVLKSHAFKWSPSRGAWVRQLTAAGIFAGKKVREALASQPAA